MVDQSDFDELRRQLEHAAAEGDASAAEILRQVGDYVEHDDGSDDEHTGILRVLSDAVYQFEAEHPRLTAAIQKVVDSLTAGGI